MSENRYTKEDILRMAEEEDVEFVRLQFPDIFGVLKNMAITASQLEKALNDECSFDGVSINGYGELSKTDLFLRPDLNTFEIFPWRPQQGKVARLICNVYNADGTPYAADTRMVLKRVVEKAKKMGYVFKVEPECEFFLFHIDDGGMPTTVTHEHAGYFDVGPVDFAENVRRDIVLNLEEMGFEVKSSHHEKAPGQHEVDFKYSDVLNTADNLLTFKMTVKSIAKRHGLHATFMPKPKSDVDGSGMHINMSLWDEEGNDVFYDKDDAYKISETARCFMAGILRHIGAITALTNPLVNSYKRLTPGFEAPVYATWSAETTFALLRVPSVIGTHAKLELRSPDPTANPYLAFAACLAAGLQGIEEKLLLAPSVDTNVSAWTDEERRNLDIERLPKNMCDAINALEDDRFIVEVIGEAVAGQYIRAKRQEWNTYRRQVTEWEIKEYLNRY
ncbi:glutamine synthetase family protein [Lacrimispora sp. NSJ-141]|uniref:Glutamine synthetase family protein n=1 Tax=Lientehia hominis TaxID=2897778 RepID=A0AAP2W8E9_9FIRM|nr:glutamine synthetase family protein [Lientehia hominis]MCD2492115.1 glutamine synthetase family protein [Lientehia hominis]